jgi:hypothetical protein
VSLTGQYGIVRRILTIFSGDRVQWFRAEAEMERWREEWEAKQADFLRCIRTFCTMSNVWQIMASSSSELGRVAYAKQKSAMYREMEYDAKDTFSKAGYQDLVRHLIDYPEGKILAEFVTTERSDPVYIIPELNLKVRCTQMPIIILIHVVLCRIICANAHPDTLQLTIGQQMTWI